MNQALIEEKIMEILELADYSRGKQKFNSGDD